MIYLFCFLSALTTALICLLSFLGGYLLGGQRHTPAPRKKEGTARLDREARIKQLQMQNFWSYNGDSQQDPAERSL